MFYPGFSDLVLTFDARQRILKPLIFDQCFLTRGLVSFSFARSRSFYLGKPVLCNFVICAPVWALRVETEQFPS